jgi:tRNA pseudouridine38-40 synthase
MHRFFVYLSYDGEQYHGWQLQPNGVTVQQRLQECLSILLHRPVFVTGAGRTDAGVHARLMVAHFDFDDVPDLAMLAYKLNQILPGDIAVHKIVEVQPDANARFSAVSRTYKYYVTTAKSPFNRQYAWRIYYPLDYDLMNMAAEILFEYNDFTSFARLHSDVKTNICHIKQAHWEQSKTDSSLWEFTIQADRFLRNMVRAIVGTLVEVGRGKMTLEKFRSVIEQQDRCKAGGSAPGYALFLDDIEYKEDIFIK